MGLKFDEIIYGRLTDDFGGHPFLIRHVCSILHRISPRERPVFVDKALYENAKTRFNDEYANYMEMILNVLKQFYGDEYEMLKYLALGDIPTFNQFSQLSPYYTNHLLGYGIVSKHNSNFSFRIESVREYLLRMHRLKKLNLSSEEMLQEISERRNALEPKLRLIVRNQMRATYGKIQAREYILDILGEPRKSKYAATPYEDLFDPNICEIYLLDLRKIINKYWGCFTNIFTNQQDFAQKIDVINKARNDAHAKKITQEEFTLFRVSMTAIEDQVREFSE